MMLDIICKQIERIDVDEEHHEDGSNEQDGSGFAILNEPALSEISSQTMPPDRDPESLGREICKQS